MKKIMLALLAVSVFATAEAQKGTILKYGNAHIYTDKNDRGNGNEDKQFNWYINPGVGYQFTDNITVGLRGGYWSNFNENRTANAAQTMWTRNAYEEREWQLGAFFRYTHYFGKRFFMFGQLDLSYVSGQQITENELRQVDFVNDRIDESVTYNYEYYNGFQAFYTPMIGVFVYDGLALNFGFGSLGYRYTTYDAPTNLDQSNFVFDFGNQFNFGISVNMDCKRKTGNVKPGDDLRQLNMDAGSDDDDE